MPEIINLNQNFVDQKISELIQKSSHPYHSAFFNLSLRKKLVVCILNQLQPNYVLSESGYINLKDVQKLLSQHEQKRIERLLNNAIVPTLQEADALKYFPCQTSAKPQREAVSSFG
ncbi:MAG: late competence development ComFB family protein [Leptolyngbyaceae cyanobacterium]